VVGKRKYEFQGEEHYKKGKGSVSPGGGGVEVRRGEGLVESHIQ